MGSGFFLCFKNAIINKKLTPSHMADISLEIEKLEKQVQYLVDRF